MGIWTSIAKEPYVFVICQVGPPLDLHMKSTVYLLVNEDYTWVMINENQKQKFLYIKIESLHNA